MRRPADGGGAVGAAGAPYDIDPYARELIRLKLKRLVGQHGFFDDDADDLWQELALHAHVASAAYRPERSSPFTFYNKVLERKATDLALRNRRQKRDRRREQRLDPDPRARRRPDPTPRIDLRLDLEQVMAELRESDRTLATALAESPLTEAARRTGLSRQQARDARKRVGVHLTSRGMP